MRWGKESGALISSSTDSQTSVKLEKVARARGSHFARPDKKPSSTRGGGSGGGDRGRVATGRTTDNDGPKESWPGPWSEARRVSERTLKCTTEVPWFRYIYSI